MEKDIVQGPVFLTKNGYGSMVVMTLEDYDRLAGGIEEELDKADSQAAITDKRYSHDEVFGSFRSMIENGHAAQA